MRFKDVAVALATSAAAMGGWAGHAQAATAEVAVPVALDDLNLQSQVGARAALRRIERAAGAVCGDRPALVNLGRNALYKACMEATVDRAVERLGAPLVTAAYKGSAHAQPLLAASK